MKVYDRVKQILVQNPKARNSDHHLYWLVASAFLPPWKESAIDYELWMRLPKFESVSRARRKVQELHPELGATSSEVKRVRRQKQDTKGTFIYRERERV